jgi:hypothetical protein
MVRKSFVVFVLLFCLSTVRADDEKDLVGRWENPVIKSAYFRFNSDGTCRDVRLLETREGKYRLFPGAIEFEYQGIFGRYKEEVKYRLEGDTLKLWYFEQWIEYSRAR